MYPLQRSIILYLSLSVLRGLKTHFTKLKQIEEQKLVAYLDLFFKKYLAKLMISNDSNKWFGDTFNVSLVLIEIFCESGLVLQKENIYNNNKSKSNVILWLQRKLKNTNVCTNFTGNTSTKYT